MGLPRRHRLRKTAEFKRAFSRGRRAGDRLISVVAAPGASCRTRYGLAVSSRVGNAVTRNQIKRRLREILGGLETDGRWDVVVSARPSAAAANYQGLENSVRRMAQRLRIANSPPPPRQS